MADDAQLLCDYVANRSPVAFAELVSRQLLDFRAATPARSLGQAMAGALCLTSAPLAASDQEWIEKIVADSLSAQPNAAMLGRRWGSAGVYEGAWFEIPPEIWEKLLVRAPERLSPLQLDSLRDFHAQVSYGQILKAARASRSVQGAN